MIKTVLEVINFAVAEIKNPVRHFAHETKIRTKMQIEDCAATRKNSTRFIACGSKPPTGGAPAQMPSPQVKIFAQPAGLALSQKAGQQREHKIPDDPQKAPEAVSPDFGAVVL